MRLSEIVRELNLEVVNDGGDLEREISCGYASDLMSDAIAHADAGAIWITLQVHQNVIAIASMKELGAVLITQGRRPLDDALEKARKADVPILISDLAAFELIGKLYEIGIRGS